MVKKKINFFCAIALLVLAVLLYLILHGTENLFVSKIIKRIFPSLSKIQSVKITNSFVKNYLVDALWFISFLLFCSIFEKRVYCLLALLVALVLEFLQMAFLQLGTFDWMDVILYIAIFVFFLLLEKIKHFLFAKDVVS